MEKEREKSCVRIAEHTRLFQLLLKGELGRVDGAKLEREILEVAKRIVEQLKRSRHWWFAKIGISGGDLAADAVAELLVKDGKGPCAGLRKSMERMRSSRKDAVSLCHCVHVIIKKLVLQAYSRLLAQHDPAQAHMLRALRHHARNTPELTRRLTHDGYAYHLTATDDLPGQPYMPWEELSARIARHPNIRKQGGGAPANPAVRALYICLDLLASQDEYRRAVHEHDVLQIAKELLASEYAAEEGESYEHDASDITECTIHSDIAAALEKTGARVEASYVRTRKLTAVEACDMLKAIEEFCSHAAEDECKGWTQHLDPDALNGGAREKLLKIFENVRTRFRLELRKLLADSE